MTPDDLEFLSRLMRLRTGMTLRGDKAYFLESRLGPLARRENLPSVDALVAELRDKRDEGLINAAVEAMAITDTAFFRDGAVFDHLRDELLPELFASRAGGALHVWSAGCATGQEAYSVAMLADALSERLAGLKLDILGSDVSCKALEKASSGLYTQFEAQRGLPIRMLLKHFDKVDDAWRVKPELRQRVRWRQLNLLEARRSVRPFDLILCRNVAGYFEPEMRVRVLEQLAPSLAPDGYLVLGAGETANAPSFESSSGAFRVYRRRRAAGLAAA